MKLWTQVTHNGSFLFIVILHPVQQLLQRPPQSHPSLTSLTHPHLIITRNRASHVGINSEAEVCLHGQHIVFCSIPLGPPCCFKDESSFLVEEFATVPLNRAPSVVVEKMTHTLRRRQRTEDQSYLFFPLIFVGMV